MGHCYICDYSDTVVSSVYLTLEAVDPIGNALVYDEKIDKFICVDCIGVSLSNYRSLDKQSANKKLVAGELEFELEEWDEKDDSSIERVPWSTEGLETGV